MLTTTKEKLTFDHYNIYKWKKNSMSCRNSQFLLCSIARRANALVRINDGLPSSSMRINDVLRRQLIAALVSRRSLSNPNSSSVADGAVSISVLKSQAEAGNVIAQFNLGQAYLHGHHGISKSLSEATLWIRR